MKSRKAAHRKSDLSTLAKDAVASAKARRSAVMNDAELEATTGGIGIGGHTSGAILTPDFGDVR